ncbi:STAS domain-containing protein [Streptomyces sp. NPDC058279]|uniref:STAS domain-containing protein n=1 Tax=Streptomyces sp. NPDC058279 TaxID=3346418 RepID=UPI0036F17D5E
MPTTRIHHLNNDLLSVTTVRTESAWVITVSGEVDLDTADPLRLTLEAASSPRQPLPVLLNLRGVRFGGSALVNLLLRARSSLGPDRLTLADPAPRVIRLLRLTGLDAHFEVGPRPAAARAEPDSVAKVTYRP